MSPELEAFLLRQYRAAYDAAKRGAPREKAVDLAVIVTAAWVEEEVQRRLARAGVVTDATSLRDARPATSLRDALP